MRGVGRSPAGPVEAGSERRPPAATPSAPTAPGRRLLDVGRVTAGMHLALGAGRQRPRRRRTARAGGRPPGRARALAAARTVVRLFHVSPKRLRPYAQSADADRDGGCVRVAALGTGPLAREVIRAERGPLPRRPPFHVLPNRFAGRTPRTRRHLVRALASLRLACALASPGRPRLAQAGRSCPTIGARVPVHLRHSGSGVGPLRIPQRIDARRKTGRSRTGRRGRFRRDVKPGAASTATATGDLPTGAAHGTRGQGRTMWRRAPGARRTACSWARGRSGRTR